MPADLPVPRLVTVELDPKAPASGADLERALKAKGVDAEVDDHSRWTADIMRAGDVERGVAIGLFALLLAVAGRGDRLRHPPGPGGAPRTGRGPAPGGRHRRRHRRLFQARFARSAAQAGLLGRGAGGGGGGGAEGRAASTRG